MKILITGGAGFIGSHLVEALSKQEHRVVVIDNLSSGDLKNLPIFTKFYKTDITNYQELKEIFEKEKPEIIFHFAAQINLRKSVENPIHDAKVNIIGSLNLLELAKKHNIKKFIFSSTGAIYGTNLIPNQENQPPLPQSPYTLSKLTIERYLKLYKKNHNLDYVSLRYSNVYGPRQNPKGEAGVVAIFLDKMLKNQQPEIFGSGEQTRDYVYVKDVVNANLIAMEKGQGTYNIATSKQTNVIEIFNQLNNLFNRKFKKVHTQEKPGEQEHSCLNFEKAKNQLNWIPRTNLEEGIIKTYNWFINHKHQ